MLHGVNATAELAQVLDIIERTTDTLAGDRRMHAEWRQSAVLGSAVDETSRMYIPYAWPTSSGCMNKQPSCSNLEHGRFRMRRDPSEVAPSFSDEPSLVFISMYPSSFPEVFYRSVMHVLEYHSCSQPSGKVHLRPNFWSRTYLDLLAPFSQYAVQPLALYPYSSPEPEFKGAPFNIRAEAVQNNRTFFDVYARASEQYFRGRTSPACHEVVQVCDFSKPTSHGDIHFHLRPWTTMQTVVSRLWGDAPFQPGAPRFRACDHERNPTCKLVISFVQRRGRRQLLNLQELVTACNGWQPQLATCRIVDLSAGLKTAQHILRTTDVLVSPHGGDVTNALALHDRASVVEILPVHIGGCPCELFIKLFNSNAKNEDGRVFYHRVKATNSSHPDHKVAKTFHAHLELSWAVLQPTLDAIVAISGNTTRYSMMTRNGWLKNIESLS